MPMPKYKQEAADSQRGASTLWPVMDMVLGMHTLMASSYQRFLEVQHEAANVATAEISAYRSELLRTMTAAAQVTWPHVHPYNAPKIVEVTRAWFELASQTQAAMLQVLRESVLDRGHGMPLVPGQETGTFADRRRKSVVVDFPDRRAA